MKQSATGEHCEPVAFRNKGAVSYNSSLGGSTRENTEEGQQEVAGEECVQAVLDRDVAKGGNGVCGHDRSAFTPQGCQFTALNKEAKALRAPVKDEIGPSGSAHHDVAPWTAPATETALWNAEFGCCGRRVDCMPAKVEFFRIEPDAATVRVGTEVDGDARAGFGGHWPAATWTAKRAALGFQWSV